MQPRHLVTLGAVLLAHAPAAAGVSVRAVPAANASSAFPSYDAFLALQHKVAQRVGSAEYDTHRQAYERHLAEADRQNRDPSKTWTAGVNRLWDWTDSELASLYGYRRSTRGRDGARAWRAHVSGFLDHSADALPEEKVWNSLASSRTIQNQGGCGSCWAIVAATVLSAHSEIHTQASRVFSAQELVSCMPNPQECGGEGGCKGATVELAYDYVMKHGLAEAHQCPYAGRQVSCAESFVSRGTANSSQLSNATNINSASSFGMVGWERLPENKYMPLLVELVQRGPVGVSVAAHDWHLYANGLFNACPKDAILNHAVTLIGYGKAAELAYGHAKYWLIQNSWGQDWGEKGTMRLLRREEHEDEAWCGIDNKPELGSGCKGGPPQVTVCGTCGILYDSVVPHFAR